MMQQQGKTQYRKLKLVKSLTQVWVCLLKITQHWHEGEKGFPMLDLCTEVGGEGEGLLLAWSPNIQQVTIVQWTLKLIFPDTLSHTFK